jgi:hypothetical protein
MKLKWVETLGQACAALFDGTILVNGRLHGTSWAWVGFRSEVPLMEELFLRLWECYPGIVEHDLLEAKRNHAEQQQAMFGHLGLTGFGFTPAQTMKFKHGHGQGFALSLYRRCDALARARKTNATGTSTALVLVRDGAMTKFFQSRNIRTVKSKQTKGASEGFQAGYQRGNGIALGGALK